VAALWGRDQEFAGHAAYRRLPTPDYDGRL
jgi:hypothetical protein